MQRPDLASEMRGALRRSERNREHWLSLLAGDGLNAGERATARAYLDIAEMDISYWTMELAQTERREAAGGGRAGVRLFVGGHAGTIQGEREDLTGDRCFTAAHPPQAARFCAAWEIDALLDSGAFTDPPHKRLAPDAALDRQFAWERWATRIWQLTQPWQARKFVSYDRLIDEKWITGAKHKQRWTVAEGDSAVAETVAAAHYLASQRERIGPRTLVLSCQGVDAYQYQECVAEVLKVAQPHDWIGLGGWCIIGMKQAWMPTFWQTMRLVLPQIAAAGVRHIHIFGVLFQKAIGGLLWLADRHNLTVSTDSTAPVLACTWKNWRKAGARDPYWRNNVRWWTDTLSDMRHSEHYKQPPLVAPARQEVFL